MDFSLSFFPTLDSAFASVARFSLLYSPLDYREFADQISDCYAEYRGVMESKTRCQWPFVSALMLSDGIPVYLMGDDMLRLLSVFIRRLVDRLSERKNAKSSARNYPSSFLRIVYCMNISDIQTITKPLYFRDIVTLYNGGHDINFLAAIDTTSKDCVSNSRLFDDFGTFVFCLVVFRWFCSTEKVCYGDSLGMWQALQFYLRRMSFTAPFGMSTELYDNMIALMKQRNAASGSDITLMHQLSQLRSLATAMLYYIANHNTKYDDMKKKDGSQIWFTVFDSTWRCISQLPPDTSVRTVIDHKAATVRPCRIVSHDYVCAVLAPRLQWLDLKRFEEFMDRTIQFRLIPDMGVGQFLASVQFLERDQYEVAEFVDHFNRVCTFVAMTPQNWRAMSLYHLVASFDGTTGVLAPHVFLDRKHCFRVWFERITGFSLDESRVPMVLAVTKRLNRQQTESIMELLKKMLVEDGTFMMHIDRLIPLVDQLRECAKVQPVFVPLKDALEPLLQTPNNNNEMPKISAKVAKEIFDLCATPFAKPKLLQYLNDWLMIHTPQRIDFAVDRMLELPEWAFSKESLTATSMNDIVTSVPEEDESFFYFMVHLEIKSRLGHRDNFPWSSREWWDMQFDYNLIVAELPSTHPLRVSLIGENGTILLAKTGDGVYFSDRFWYLKDTSKLTYKKLLTCYTLQSPDPLVTKDSIEHQLTGRSPNECNG
jgi:hypothetical protein